MPSMSPPDPIAGELHIPPACSEQAVLTELSLLHQSSQDGPLLMQTHLPRAVTAGGNCSPSLSQGSCKSIIILSHPNTIIQQPQLFLSLSGHALEPHVPSPASPGCLSGRQNKGAEMTESQRYPGLCTWFFQSAEHNVEPLHSSGNFSSAKSNQVTEVAHKLLTGSVGMNEA